MRAPKLYTFRGQRMTMAMVMDLTGWSYTAVAARRVGDVIEDRPLITIEDRRRSAAKRYLFRGEMMTAREIATRTGRSLSWVYHRVSGGSVIEHDDMPRDIPINSTPIYFNGESLPPYAWARRLGIDHNTLYDRLYRGWPIKRALTEQPRKTGYGSVKFRNARIITRIQRRMTLARMVYAFNQHRQPQPDTHTDEGRGQAATFVALAGTGAGSHARDFQSEKLNG